MACEKKKFTGKDVVLEFHIGCGDTLPLESQWKRIGSMRTKDFEITWDTADATADDSVGSLRENIATFQNLTMSGDGTVKLGEGDDEESLRELLRHFVTPDATSGQPVAWMRMTFPDLTFIAFMLLTTFSRNAPHDDVATYSIEASATSSNFGLIVEDTIPADAADVTSVDVTPATLSISVGSSAQLNKAILPSGAPQGVTWVSSDPTKATVTQTGLVTAVAAGSATITVRSNADQTKSDTVAVTVTA